MISPDYREPNPEGFPEIKGARAGRKYVWVPHVGRMLADYQNKGYTTINQHCDNNSVRYQLMAIGETAQGFGTGNIALDINVALPDETPGGVVFSQSQSQTETETDPTNPLFDPTLEDRSAEGVFPD